MNHPRHTDLTDKIRRLALKQEEKERASAAADVRPRQYRFRRVTPMELLQQQEERRRQQQQAAAGAGAGEGGPAVSARRVLLPAVQTEDEAAVGADIASFLEEQQSRLAGGGKGRVLGGEGLVVFVDDADSKVRVMRDRRSKEDLVAAFPDVDAAIVDDVWARTRLFAAASTILASLRNSGRERSAC